MFVATPAEKLAWLRLSSRPPRTQEEFADLIGVTRNVLANFESGRTLPKRSVAVKVKKLFGQPDDWLYDGGDLPSPIPILQSGSSAPLPGMNQVPKLSGVVAQPGVGRRLFPVLGEGGASAFPLEPSEPTEEYVEFSDDLYREDRFAIRVKGKSLEGRVSRDSYALIQPCADPEPGLLVAARDENYNYVIKVLKRVNDRWELHPINPDFPVIIPGEGWCVEGYVVGLRHQRGKKKYLEEGDDDGIYP